MADAYSIVNESPFDTIVKLVLDRSGSMQSCKKATIEGYNEYLSGLQNSEVAGRTGFELIQFDHETQSFGLKGVTECKPLNTKTFVPRGSTALYDAIGSAICGTLEGVLDENGTKVYSSNTGNASVIVAILTDGYENASFEWNKDSITKLMEEKREEGWTFVFLGANEDVWEVSQGLGISAGNTYNFNTTKMGETFSDLSASTVAYATASTQTLRSTGKLYQTDNFFNQNNDK